MESDHLSPSKPLTVPLLDLSSSLTVNQSQTTSISPSPVNSNSPRSKKSSMILNRGQTFQKPKVSILVPNNLSRFSALKLMPQSCTLPGHGSGLSAEEKLRQILLKTDRNDYEAQTLFKAISKNVFFEKFLELDESLESNAMVEICKKIKYERVYANSIVFRQGDVSNGMLYIVYSGDLNVHVRDIDVIVQQNIHREQKELEAQLEKEEKKEEIKSPLSKDTLEGSPQLTRTKSIAASPRKSATKIDMGSALLKKQAMVMPKTPNKDLTFFDALPQEQEKPPQVSRGLSRFAIVTKAITQAIRMKNVLKTTDLIGKFGLVVDTVHEGGFFGERALLGDKPRAATVVTTTDCELLVLTRDAFLSLKSRFDKKKKIILDFMLTSIPTLDQVHSNGIIEKLYYVFKEKTYEHGSAITTENSPGEYIYLLYEGVCEIIKNVKVDQTKILKSNIANFSPLLGIGRTTTQSVMICTIIKGTFFGEELLFQNSDIYNYTVKVVSPKATVFAIHKSRFNMRFPRSAYIAMEKIFAQKIASHDKRLSEAMSGKFHRTKDIKEIVKSPIKESDGSDTSEKEIIKPMFIKKDPGPYYNAFKNPRSKAKISVEDRVQHMSLQNLDYVPGNDKPLSPGKAKTLAGNLSPVPEKSDQEKGGSEESPRRKAAGLKAYWSENLNSGSATDRGVYGSNNDEAIDPISGLSIKVVNGVRSFNIRDPNFAARDEYFEKMNMNFPLLMQGKDRASKEEIINNIDNFRVDVGYVDPEVQRRYKLKQQEIRGKEPSKPMSNGKSNPVQKIRDALVSRKKKFEKKNQKMTSSFRNLVQSRASTSDEFSRTLRNDTSRQLIKAKTQRDLKLEEARSEYAFVPLSCATVREKSLGISNQCSPMTPFSLTERDKESYLESDGQLLGLKEGDKAAIKSLLTAEGTRKRAESNGKNTSLLKVRTEFPINMIKVHAQTVKNLDSPGKKSNR